MSAEVKQSLARGQFEDTIRLARQALQTEQSESQQKELRYCIAVAYRLKGDILQAIKSNTDNIQRNPEYARTYQELGYCFLAQQQHQDAANYFYRATQLNPALVACWRNLLTFYQQTQNHKAEHIAQLQLTRLEKLPKAILGARDLMYEGQLEGADKVCRQYLQQHKHDAEALTLLGELGIQLKAYPEAEFVLESCVALHPQHYFAGLEYIKLLNQIGKFSQSLKICEQLLKHHSQDKPLQLAKAGALLGIGDISASIELYQQLLKEDEQQPYIQLLLGHALKANGQIEDAIAAYQMARQFKPDFGDAYWSLANTKTYRFSESELQSMENLTNTAETNLEDKIHIHFALGKALEDAKEYQQSFLHYESGNKLKQAQTGYDISAMERQVDRQITACNQALFSNLTGCGAEDPAPIFIVGLPRAGSTLLEQILASHSQVEGTMELHNVLSLVSKLRGKANAYPENLQEIEPAYFQRFGEQYLKDTQIYRSDKAFFIDKMPNNFMHVGLIKLMLPNAKVIDARRAPMDCCFSGYKQLFGEGQEFSYDLDSIARYYRSYEKLMAHWDQVLPGFVLKVQHEDVIDDVETQIRRLLDFCGLEFEAQCLRFYETQRAIKTPSSEQVKQPINRKGQDRWRHYETHLQPLKERFLSPRD
ncbi:tetratricopeptide repeat-containing sulfotransferase family protein [Planctobacterium marinum]|uniref:TPR domain protein n=1 Tax=Planctobacterium marinum TaxID=1631968 RepID=A0AA48I6T5_9ALTE|nr:hypothetical protein MACH26_25260 [Planctobacterium marinum]